MKGAIILGIIFGSLSGMYYGNGYQSHYSYQWIKEPSSVQAHAQEHREGSLHKSTKTTPTTSEERHGDTPTPTHVASSGKGSSASGMASFYTNEYCEKYHPACITANGEVFDDTQFTAACSYRWDLGSTLRVTSGNESILVRCNDRGSFEESYGRILDLSKASFEALAPLSQGVIKVEVELVK